MKVKSISRAGKADVYNMEVEDTHNFVIQGGVISHNCADEVRYFCMARPIKARTAKKPDEFYNNPLSVYLDVERADLAPARARTKIEIISEDDT